MTPAACRNCGWPIQWNPPFWVHSSTGWRKCVVFLGKNTAGPYQNGDEGTPRVNVAIEEETREEQTGQDLQTRAPAPPTPVGTTPDSSPQTGGKAKRQ